MTAIRILDLDGEPFDCGLAHGRALAREVADNVETYLRRFEASGLDRAAAQAEGACWREAIAAQSPDYAEELRGIAAGSGQTEDTIAMLNARYEIAFLLFGKDARAGGPRDIDGCSTFGALPEATADGRTYLGQNWDWLAGIHGRAAVTRLRRPGKPRQICLTEAGIAGGKMGLNEHGIGLVENGLAGDGDGRNPFEKPFHVRCREVLEADRFDRALTPIVATARVGSANFMIGDAAGEIIDLETSADHVAPLHPRDGILTHSNHFLDPRHGVSLMERISTSTLFRAARLERLLRQRHGQLDVAAFQEALGDHLSRPKSICRHPDDSQPAAVRTMTVCSVLLDLDRRVMHVANGPPCENDFVAIALDEKAAAAA